MTWILSDSKACAPPTLQRNREAGEQRGGEHGLWGQTAGVQVAALPHHLCELRKSLAFPVSSLVKKRMMLLTPLL